MWNFSKLRVKIFNRKYSLPSTHNHKSGPIKLLLKLHSPIICHSVNKWKSDKTPISDRYGDWYDD